MRLLIAFVPQDDPLSALDVHVGRRLFEDGILKMLTQRKVTVILVTHQLQYLNQAHLVTYHFNDVY